MTGDHAVTAQRVDAASTARKRFAAGKTLAQGGIYFRRASEIKGFPDKPLVCLGFTRTGEYLERCKA